MRLIDANKLQTTTTYFGISDTPVEVVKKSVIDNAKTVEAVSLSVIEKIKANVSANVEVKFFGAIKEKSLFDIIDKAVKECTHEDT